ncbi:MAG TPA: NAD-dependent epimerase/dehydratase family protein [Phycisphaerales bacterium]|nr:NAD-dependent epimerase/dehydratase family protein [Phycisphaerales bacterium]
MDRQRDSRENGMAPAVGKVDVVGGEGHSGECTLPSVRGVPTGDPGDGRSTMSEQTVAVAGATGFVGRHVVGELLRRGHAVRALVRTPAKASEAFAGLEHRDRLTLVQTETISADSASRLVEGASACVNCIGIIRERAGERFEQVHVRAVEMLASACTASGTDRFVHISALAAHPDGRAEYQKTKYAGEQALRRSGLEWTILRPGLIVGSGGELTEMMVTWARGKAQPFFFMPYFTRRADGQWSYIPAESTDPIVAPVTAEDVARAACDSLDNDETIGEIYNVVGPEEVTWPELLTFVRDSTRGAKPTIRPGGIPATAAYATAKIAGAVGMEQMLPFDAGMAAMSSEDSTATLDKFEAHFGFTPDDFHPALQRAVAEY